MIDRVVAITGPPGSGKSSAGRRVAERLGLEYRSAGERFRGEAGARGISLEAFSHYAETHEEVDRALDDGMIRLAAPGRLLDGRIVGALCHRRHVPCYAILVTAEAAVRYRRLSERDQVSRAEAERQTQAREASERDRYRRYYGIDLDREPSDLTVDSSRRSVDEVVEAIVTFLAPHRTAPP